MATALAGGPSAPALGPSGGAGGGDGGRGVSIEVKLAGALPGPAPAAHPALLAALEALAGRPPFRLLEHEVVLRSPLPSGGEVRLVRDLAAAAASGAGTGPPGEEVEPPPPSTLRRSASNGTDEADAVAAATTAAAAAPPPPPPTDAAWTAVHYGQRLRGRGAAALPAAARPRTAVPVTGTDVPAAWVAAGFTPVHESVRDGVVVAIAGKGGVPVRVSVCSLLRVVARGGLAPGGPPPAPIPGLPADAAALPAAPGLVLVEAAAVGGEVDYPVAAADVAAVGDGLRAWCAMRKD
jgi:hypothetical protein